jgi:hypothetical protein
MRHGARVFTLGGRVDHAYSMRLTREAARISALGAGLLLASLVSAAAQDPHTEIFTGLEASNNAITGYLGAGYAFGKTLRAWLADPRGRRAWALRLPGNSVGAGADLGTTFDGETSYGAALLGSQFRTQVLFLNCSQARRSRRSEHHATRSGEFGARQRRRSQARSRKLAGPFADVVPLRRCQY